MSTTSEFAFLSDMFPDVNPARVRAVLESSGNVEQAMDILFAQQASTPPPASPAPSPQARSSVPAMESEDERLARQLQEQFDAEEEEEEEEEYEEFGQSAQWEIPSFDEEARNEINEFVYDEDEDERIARELFERLQHEEDGFDADAALARQLQNEWAEESNPYAWGGSPYDAMGSSDNMGLGLDDLLQKAMTDETLAPFIEQLKGEIIPTMEQEVLKMKLPSFEESVDIPRFGEVEFGVGELRLENFTIPAKDLVIGMEGNQLHITARNIQGSLQRFAWFFKQLKFPKLADKGQAQGRMADTSLDVLLQVAGTGVRVTRCAVRIGKLDAKVKKNARALLYNIVLNLVIRLVKSHLEDFLSTSFTRLIENSSSML